MHAARNTSSSTGTATLETPPTGIDLTGPAVVIIDDVLATGGTMPPPRRFPGRRRDVLTARWSDWTALGRVVEPLAVTSLTGSEWRSATANQVLGGIAGGDGWRTSTGRCAGSLGASTGWRHRCRARRAPKSSTSASRRVRARLARRMTAQRRWSTRFSSLWYPVHREVYPKADLAILQRAYEP